MHDVTETIDPGRAVEAVLAELGAAASVVYGAARAAEPRLRAALAVTAAAVARLEGEPLDRMELAPGGHD